MKRVLDSDGGVTSTFHYDNVDETVTIHSTQDVEPIIEANKVAQTDGDGYSPSRDLRKVATIPFTVFQDWLKQDGLTWWDYHNNMSKRERARYRAKKLSEHTAFRASSGPI